MTVEALFIGMSGLALAAIMIFALTQPGDREPHQFKKRDDDRRDKR